MLDNRCQVSGTVGGETQVLVSPGGQPLGAVGEDLPVPAPGPEGVPPPGQGPHVVTVTPVLGAGVQDNCEGV